MIDQHEFFHDVLTAGSILAGFCGSFLVFRIEREAGYFRTPGHRWYQQHFTPSLLLLIVAGFSTTLFGVLLPTLALATDLTWIRPFIVVGGLTFSAFTLLAYVLDELVHYQILCPLTPGPEGAAPRWLAKLVKLDWHGFRRELRFWAGGLAVALVAAIGAGWLAHRCPSPEGRLHAEVSAGSKPSSVAGHPTSSPPAPYPTTTPRRNKPSSPE